MMVKSLSYRTHHSQDRPNLCQKIMPRSSKNVSRSIFTTDANLTTLKTALDSILFKSEDFSKMVEKNPLLKALSPILDDFKIFTKGTIFYDSSDEKHDGEITKPVWPTVLEIRLCSMQEGGLKAPKMVLVHLFQRIRIRRPQ